MLEDEHEVALRIIDLRWLAPLNEEQLAATIAECGHLLIVDECRGTGSISEALMALAKERLPAEFKVKRLTAEDSFIPLGRAATCTLPGKESILAAALSLLGKEKPLTVVKSA